MKQTVTKREKSLTTILLGNSGRNNTGKITTRQRGGRQKQFYREIDFRRDKHNIPAVVKRIEYDPNRNVDIALIQYADGIKRYILQPVGLQVGETVISGASIDIKLGNSLPLRDIPIGIAIHNIELHQGKGGQLARGAGTMGVILAKEGDFAHIKMPSGEIRKIHTICYATIGQLGRVEAKEEKLGKAGRSRHLGRRPVVRGTAQNPRSHPHGGGEGRSGEGMKQAKTPWGKPARGFRTRRKKKFSDTMILQRRK